MRRMIQGAHGGAEKILSKILIALNIVFFTIVPVTAQPALTTVFGPEVFVDDYGLWSKPVRMLSSRVKESFSNRFLMSPFARGDKNSDTIQKEKGDR